ncbi:TIGR03943 family putative permease subunit [Streptomyces himalayensis]|uniref:TIGR03943 family protein n=1 Tax=Streptomyces himalayensis subsp. himalayensis TaxID=2756131 RepID=A0A7W0DUM0_9ACTN|nr:TIGR03943 family protein [Streptomyces himalayensis]MBA2951554.1 TIGR03943 family protein [Streptomyces himalayensis subsp. himalayensis]
MRRRFEVLLLLLAGAAVLRISLFSELYLRYVKPGLRPLLIATGALLVLLGLVAAVREAIGYARGRRDAYQDAGHEEGHSPHAGHEWVHPPHAGHEEGHSEDAVHERGHAHSHGPRVGWLLYLPAVLLLLFAPPALGSYTASREAARAAQGAGTFPALPDTNPLPLTVREFSSRAVYDTGKSLKDRTVLLTGFVSPSDGGDEGTWYLSRLVVGCCAADAQVFKVEIHGATALDADTWVTVTGVWRPTGAPGSEAAEPALDASAVRKIHEPSNPYDDAAPAADGS